MKLVKAIVIPSIALGFYLGLSVKGSWLWLLAAVMAFAVGVLWIKWEVESTPGVNEEEI